MWMRQRFWIVLVQWQALLPGAQAGVRIWLEQQKSTVGGLCGGGDF